MSENSEDGRAKAIITIEADMILRKGITVNDLVEKYTEFIAEPTSTNGCITDMKVILVTKI